MFGRLCFQDPLAEAMVSSTTKVLESADIRLDAGLSCQRPKVPSGHKPMFLIPSDSSTARPGLVFQASWPASVVHQTSGFHIWISWLAFQGNPSNKKGRGAPQKNRGKTGTHTTESKGLG